MASRGKEGVECEVEGGGSGRGGKGWSLGEGKGGVDETDGDEMGNREREK